MRDAHRRSLIHDLSLIITLGISLAISACQDQRDLALSPWTVANWIIGDALEQSDLDLSARADYIEVRPAAVLSDLSALADVEGRVGMLNLEITTLGHWRGLYGYLHRTWPVGLQVDLSQRQGLWTIHMLPEFERYREMIDLIGSEDSNPELRLPWSAEGAPWSGGLIGRDLQGRPLSAIPLVWTPSGMSIDGIALGGEVNQSRVSARLIDAFTRRSQLARASQASYQPHVAIAIPAQTPALQLVRLIAWAEGAGAIQISLIVDSPRGAALLYLAHRVEVVRLLNPQRLVIGRLREMNLRLNVQHTDRNRPEPTYADVDFQRVDENISPHDQKRAAESINTFLSDARGTKHIDGVSLMPTAEATVADVVSAMGLIRHIDVELPITIAPAHVSTKDP